MRTRILILALVLTGCGAKKPSIDAITDAGVDANSSQMAQDPATIVNESCLSCHSSEMLKQQRLTPAQWDKVVKKMVGWGAPVQPENSASVVAWLSSQYGPDAGAYEVATVRADDAANEIAVWPDGVYANGDSTRGATLFGERCAPCHAANARGQIGVNLVDRPLLHHADEVAKLLRAGRGKMPPQPAITDPEIADVLAYLRGLASAR